MKHCRYSSEISYCFQRKNLMERIKKMFTLAEKNEIKEAISKQKNISKTNMQ